MSSALLDAALSYTAKGWRVVPIPHGQKGPRTQGWQHMRLERHELPRHFAGQGNIGIILGEPSGWLVDVDLDSPEARELADSFLPHTDAVSGRDGSPGSHRWYIAPGSVTKRHSFEDRKCIVEIRSTGGQTVVHPSIHPSGEQYGAMSGEPARVDAAKLAAAVEALAEAAVKMRGGEPPRAQDPTEIRQPSNSNPTVPADLEQRAIAYLMALPPSIEHQGGHICAYRAASALVHGFALEPAHALALLERHFNPRCLPPWSARELEHKVSDAARKGHARTRGYLRDAERAAEQLSHTIDISGLLGQANRVAQNGAAHTQVVHSTTGPEETGAAMSDPLDPGPFPEHLLSVPGFVGQVMAYNLATAHRPQPVLALAGAIALQAVLCGRKVRDRRGNRTNLQIVGIANSGAGKDHARQVAKLLLNDAGLSALEGTEDLASDSALISALVISPSSLFLFDEFGRFLRTASDPRKNPHLYNVISTLIKLYTSANVAFKAKGYADSRQNKVIQQPCCVVYGTSVPEHLLESLTIESLGDGFVGRLMFFEAPGNGTPCDPDYFPPPPELVTEAKWWGSFSPGGNMAGVATAGMEPKLVQTTAEARAVFKQLVGVMETQQGGLGRSLWARAEQKACQLALVYACSACAENPVIDEAAARWACDLSHYLTRRMIWLAHTWVADSDFDRKQKKVLRMIRDAGGRMTRHEVTRHLQRMPTRERAEVLANLVETGQIRAVEEPTDRTPRVVYVVG